MEGAPRYIEAAPTVKRSDLLRLPRERSQGGEEDGHVEHQGRQHEAVAPSSSSSSSSDSDSQPT
jgi:hypothetical protein